MRAHTDSVNPIGDASTTSPPMMAASDRGTRRNGHLQRTCVCALRARRFDFPGSALILRLLIHCWFRNRAAP